MTGKNWLPILALGLVWGEGGAMAQDRDLSKLEQEVIDGDIMYTVIPPDRIPAIHDPEFATAEEAAGWMYEDEIVMGVVGEDGEARAYSAWHLEHHEIVNDRIGGVPIAVTW